MYIYHRWIYSSIFGSNRQHSLLDFHKERIVLIKKTSQVTLKTTMLEYLVINISFVSDVYMDYIAKMKC